MITSKIKNIRKCKDREDVYDILNAGKNHNFVCCHQVVANCDEAINFACLSGDTRILIPKKGWVPIKTLEGKRNFYVHSYNVDKKCMEVKKAFGCRRVKKDILYKVTFTTGEVIKCTKEHKFLLVDGSYKELREIKWGNYNTKKKYNDDVVQNYIPLNLNSAEYKGKPEKSYIISIVRVGEDDTYEILGVKDNGNYVAENLIVKNSSENWNKAENKELKKKLGQVRTKHLFFILCFPLKIQKLDKVYLENYVNYWIDLFGRGIGALYVKDKNPYYDSWRIKEFAKLGSYSEFTKTNKVENILSRHPNFWYIIKAPKPSASLYNKYLKVREFNVYDDSNVLSTVNKYDIIKAILIMTLKEIMERDSSLSINRLLSHLQNEYEVNIDRKIFDSIIVDSKMLVNKVKENNLGKYIK